MIRITGGASKGRSIKLPPGDVRPAMARARISLFDYLADFVIDSKVIDFYCGSGSLGFEALSRGASFVDFVDNSAKVLSITEDNAIKLGYERRCKFIWSDVFQFISNFKSVHNKAYDIAFSAPPYRIAEPDAILKKLHDSKLLRAGGSLCVEYPTYSQEPASDHFQLARRKVFGTTVLEVWDYAP